MVDFNEILYTDIQYTKLRNSFGRSKVKSNVKVTTKFTDHLKKLMRNFDEISCTDKFKVKD